MNIFGIFKEEPKNEVQVKSAEEAVLVIMRKYAEGLDAGLKDPEELAGYTSGLNISGYQIPRNGKEVKEFLKYVYRSIIAIENGIVQNKYGEEKYNELKEISRKVIDADKKWKIVSDKNLQNYQVKIPELISILYNINREDTIKVEIRGPDVIFSQDLEVAKIKKGGAEKVIAISSELYKVFFGEQKDVKRVVNIESSGVGEALEDSEGIGWIEEVLKNVEKDWSEIRKEKASKKRKKQSKKKNKKKK